MSTPTSSAVIDVQSQMPPRRGSNDW